VPRLSELIDAVQGDGPPQELVAAREALDRRTRRHVKRAARRGDPLLDGPSARYAVALARKELELAEDLRNARWFVIACAVLGPLFSLGSWQQGERALSVLVILFTGACWYILASVGPRERRARATLAANGPLAPGAVDAPLRPVPLGGFARAIGLIGLAVWIMALFAAFELLDAGHLPEAHDVISKGAIAAGIAWWVGRKDSASEAA
jgi:hypothetical protein